MSGFVFPLNDTSDRVANASLDLLGPTMYAHLVTAVPARSAALVSDLALASYPGYAPVALANRNITSNAWRFDPLLFPVNTGSTETIVGIVIVEQLGGAPASSDVPLFFSRFRFTAGPVSLPVSANQRIRFVPNTTHGFVSVPGRHLFDCGAYVEPNDTNGAIFKVGTRNGAQAFANPSARIGYFRGNTGANPLTNDGSSLIFNRNLVDSGNSFIQGGVGSMSMLDFGTLQIRFNTGARIFTAHDNQASHVVTIYGANYLPSFVPAIQANLNLWQVLGTHNIVLGQLVANSALTATKEFFRYVGFTSTAASSTFIKEIEFYNCTIASPTADLT
jgi:hypothetical protein